MQITGEQMREMLDRAFDAGRAAGRLELLIEMRRPVAADQHAAANTDEQAGTAEGEERAQAAIDAPLSRADQ